MELQLASHADDGVMIVEAAGEIDVYTAPQLNQELQKVITSGATRLALDFSKVSFLDSTGLGVLIRWHKELSAQGGEVVIVGANPSLVKVMKVTGLDELFRLYATRDQALATLKG